MARSSSLVDRDQKLGGRIRRKWNVILKEGKVFDLNADQIRGAVRDGWLTGNTAERKAIAKDLGFDWEAAAEFFETIIPIIIEMMAACA